MAASRPSVITVTEKVNGSNYGNSAECVCEASMTGSVMLDFVRN